MSLTTGSITVTWEVKGVRKLLEAVEGTMRRITLVERSGKVLHSRHGGEIFQWSFAKSSWGWMDTVERDSVGKYMIDGQDTILLRCTISAAAPFLPAPPLPSPPSKVAPVSSDLRKAYEGFFHSALARDVCFVFAGEASNGRNRVIWANKAFLSCRLENFRTMFAGDYAEGAAAVAITNDEDERHAGGLKRENAVSPQPGETPALHSSATHDQNAPLWDDDDDTLEWLPKEWLEANGPKEVEVDEGGAAKPSAPGDGKHLVKIVDAGYTTYRVMLFFLYSDEITCAPSASKFVVEVLKREAVPRHDDKAATDGVQEADSLLSRRAFLLAQLGKTDSAVELASAHAVYRLADKLDIPDLKKLAFEAIVKGFTAENVLYELISPLSSQFDEVQQAAFDFAVKNRNDVKNTTAFDRVFDFDGIASGEVDIQGAGQAQKKLVKAFAAGEGKA
ncbi:hypothetical protein JCM10213_000909 [Rhodosporidiobolus nylandii]